MTIPRKTSLVLICLLLAGCNRGETSQEQKKTTPSEGISVSIDQRAAEQEGLNGRFIEAAFPPTVKLSECYFASRPGDCLRDYPAQDEVPPKGQKWLVVAVEVNTTGGDVSLPITRIRIVDESQKEYQLVAVLVHGPDLFWDLRGYPGPPDVVFGANRNGVQHWLFAIPANGKNVTLQLGAASKKEQK